MDFPTGKLIPIASGLRHDAARAIGAHPLAGARDPVQFRRPDPICKDMKAMGFGCFRHLSFGGQLIDTTRYNEIHIEKRAEEFATTRPEEMMVYDQSAINAVL